MKLNPKKTFLKLFFFHLVIALQAQSIEFVVEGGDLSNPDKNDIYLSAFVYNSISPRHKAYVKSFPDLTALKLDVPLVLPSEVDLELNGTSYFTPALNLYLEPGQDLKITYYQDNYLKAKGIEPEIEEVDLEAETENVEEVFTIVDREEADDQQDLEPELEKLALALDSFVAFENSKRPEKDVDPFGFYGIEKLSIEAWGERYKMTGTAGNFNFYWSYLMMNVCHERIEIKTQEQALLLQFEAKSIVPKSNPEYDKIIALFEAYVNFKYASNYDWEWGRMKRDEVLAFHRNFYASYQANSQHLKGFRVYAERLVENYIRKRHCERDVKTGLYKTVFDSAHFVPADFWKADYDSLLQLAKNDPKFTTEGYFKALEKNDPYKSRLIATDFALQLDKAYPKPYIECIQAMLDSITEIEPEFLYYYGLQEFTEYLFYNNLSSENTTAAVAFMDDFAQKVPFREDVLATKAYLTKLPITKTYYNPVMYLPFLKNEAAYRDVIAAQNGKVTVVFQFKGAYQELPLAGTLALRDMIVNEYGAENLNFLYLIHRRDRRDPEKVTSLYAAKMADAGITENVYVVETALNSSAISSYWKFNRNGFLHILDEEGYKLPVTDDRDYRAFKNNHHFMGLIKEALDGKLERQEDHPESLDYVLEMVLFHAADDHFILVSPNKLEGLKKDARMVLSPVTEVDMENYANMGSKVQTYDPETHIAGVMINGKMEQFKVLESGRDMVVLKKL